MRCLLIAAFLATAAPAQAGGCDAYRIQELLTSELAISILIARRDLVNIEADPSVTSEIKAVSDDLTAAINRLDESMDTYTDQLEECS